MEIIRYGNISSDLLMIISWCHGVVDSTCDTEYERHTKVNSAFHPSEVDK